MEKKLFNLSRIKDIFEVGNITIFMSVFLSCLILLTTFAPKIDAAVHYPPGSLLQPGDVTSTHIRNDEIVDADIKTTAAIAWSKIDKTGSSLADLATRAFSATTGTVGVTRGGTGIITIADGSMFTATAADTVGTLAKGTANQIIGMNNGATTQEYKTVTAGTGISVTHGTGSITIGLGSANTLTQAITAGETLAAGEAVYVSDGSLTRTFLINADTASTDFTTGQTSGNEFWGQSMTFPYTGTITIVKIQAKKYGTPADNLTIGLQADNAGSPSGTYLASGTIAGGDLSTSYAEKSITLNYAVTGGTTYWLTGSRSGALSDTDYFMVDADSSGSFAGGSIKTYNHSDGYWSALANYDVAHFNFIIAEITGRVYKTSAATSGMYQGFIGFAQGTQAVNTSGNIIISGIASGLSSLTVGKQYYIADTAGTIAVSAGSNSRKACISLSATTCLITNIW